MTTRIVVLADTHMPRRARELPIPVLQAVSAAKLVAHLGDVTDHEVLRCLSGLAPVHAVRGNNDDPDLRSTLPEVATLTIEGHEIVLLHGDVGGPTALSVARAHASGDAVLFGHSHRAHCSMHGERLLFNPGSPTDKRWAPYRSFGIVEVEERIRASIIRLD